MGLEVLTVVAREPGLGTPLKVRTVAGVKFDEGCAALSNVGVFE